MRAKRIILVLLALVMVLLLAACGNTNNVPADNANSNEATAPIPDGTYTVDFKTDSTMFHINEALKGKATLTVKDGKMTVHIVLVSKSILNLFPGTAEDAQKSGAKILQPTEEEVTYPDGLKEKTYAFDLPVPYLDEEFDCAIIGTKGKWYDHKVSVSNPEAIK